MEPSVGTIRLEGAIQGGGGCQGLYICDGGFPLEQHNTPPLSPELEVSTDTPPLCMFPSSQRVPARGGGGGHDKIFQESPLCVCGCPWDDAHVPVFLSFFLHPPQIRPDAPPLVPYIYFLPPH